MRFSEKFGRVASEDVLLQLLKLNRAIHFSFGTDIQDGPSLRTDYKNDP